MANEAEKMRVQVTLSRETGDKIDELAQRLHVSQSKMIELLIDTAIEDNEWIIKAVTSRWAKALTAVLTGKKKRPKEAN